MIDTWSEDSAQVLVASSNRFLTAAANEGVRNAILTFARQQMTAADANAPIPALTNTDRDDLIAARLAVLKSFEEQRRRVAAGERPVQLTTSELQRPEWNETGMQLKVARDRLTAELEAKKAELEDKKAELEARKD